jgi:type I restriction enzyme S subunit|tara:strand:- start:20681 stop:21937 length:1257 start_codon:yes stop_codon:yes gene_type:complete
MSELIPAGWRLVAVDEIAKTHAGGTPSTQINEYWEGGDIPWMSSGEIHKKRIIQTDQRITTLGYQNSSAKFFPQKTVLVALAGQGKTRGTVAISEIPLTTNQSIAGIVISDKTTAPDYIFHNLDSRYEELRAASGGSGRAGLNLSIIGEQCLLLPPLPEQQKIATILSSVDDVIEKTRTQIDKLKDLKTGMMQELLTKGIGHTEFKDSPVGRIPASWGVVEIQKIARVIRGASPRPQGDPRYYGGNIPRLMVKDVTRDGKYVTPRIDYLTPEGAQLSRPVEAGTLTIVCSGTVGVPSFLEVDACIHDGFLALQDIKPLCDPEFLYYQLLPMQVIFDSAATHGGIFTNLTTDILKEFKIVLPPLSEQKEIAQTLAITDSFLRKKTDQLNQKITLKKALMQDLLTGKVRVKVDNPEVAAA